MKDHVVDDPALFVHQKIILCLVAADAGKIVGGNLLTRYERVSSPKLELSHMTDVKKPRAAAYGQMLLDDSPVLHRHLPPPELNHFRPQLPMDGVERRSL